MKTLIKNVLTSILSLLLSLGLMGVNVHAQDTIQFVQNTKTPNGLGFVDSQVDQFGIYTSVKKKGKSYTSIASRLYKPVSGDTLIVCFHGNGEGGVNGVNNNYSQLAGNKMAVSFLKSQYQKTYGGAYILAFQAPDYWYNDYTKQVKKIIDRAKKQFKIKHIFVTGLSAGGLMTERMLAKYGSYFEGALISSAAISKNDQYVEGLGGTYTKEGEAYKSYFNKKLNLAKPDDYKMYVKNYQKWLNKIAKSNVPLYFVHCTKDPVIPVQWSRFAYTTIKNRRKKLKLTGEVHFKEISSTGINKDTGLEMSGHWSWVKMYNNDVKVDSKKSMNWFVSLSKSKVKYKAKKVNTHLAPTNKTNKKNVYYFNLVAQVRDDGEKITKIVINTKGKKVNKKKLTKKLFNVKGYNVNAQANLKPAVNGNLYGENGKNPEEIKVKSVSLSKGNIVISLETKKGVLNYTDYLRNLTTKPRYMIAQISTNIFK